MTASLRTGRCVAAGIDIPGFIRKIVNDMIDGLSNWTAHPSNPACAVKPQAA